MLRSAGSLARASFRAAGATARAGYAVPSLAPAGAATRVSAGAAVSRGAGLRFNSGAAVAATGTEVSAKVLEGIERVKAVTPADARIDYTQLVSSIDEQSWFKPIGLIMEGMVKLQQVSGMPWWVEVIAVSAALRILIARKVFSSILSSARMQMHLQTIQDFSAQIKRAQAAGDTARMQEVSTQYRAFMKANNVSLFAVFTAMGWQIGLIVPFFMTLRRFSLEAHLFPEFAFGGCELAPLLHLPAPGFTLPAIAGALGVASVVLNPATTGMPKFELTAGGQKLLFGSLAAGFSGIMAFFPAAMQLASVVTAGGMVIQQLMLRTPSVRASLGFPADWPKTPEQVEAEYRKRLAAGLETEDAPVMGVWKPLFRTMSKLAAGDISGAFAGKGSKTPVYVGALGLRDPGVPAPPAAAPIVAAAAAPTAAAAPAAPAAAAPAASAPAAAPASAPAAPTKLYTHKPAANKKR